MTMETALENSGRLQHNLGYWSGFSRPSSMTVPSMKYTVPLIAEDGTVISVADKSTVLRQMLVISALISLPAAGGISFVSCSQLIRPISNAIKLMSDKMTDAITQLQVNSRKFSSQVSRMIRIADVGLGAYHRLGAVKMKSSFP